MDYSLLFCVEKNPFYKEGSQKSKSTVSIEESLINSILILGNLII
jgi:hypothetical protein